MLNKNKIVSGLAALSLASSLFAVPAFAQTAPKNATVRFVHASPDAPAVDIYVDDKRSLAGLGFKYVGRYMSMPSGKHTIKIYASSAKGAGNPVTQTDVELNAGWDYTIAATGKLANVQLKVFSDNLNLPTAGKAKVRAYQLSPTAPAINVAEKGGSTIIRGLSFPNATDYLEVDAKRYNLEVQSATDSKALLQVPNVTLAANSVESVFAFGLVGETPAFSVTPVMDRRGAATPATGAETSFSFMALAAAMVAAAGLVIKKIALVEEQA